MTSLLSSRTPAVALGLALLALVHAPSPAPAVTVPAGFVVENAFPGAAFSKPLQVVFLADGRKLVVELGGRIWVVTAAGVKLATPFIDLSLEVLGYANLGLLGVAIDPDFGTNGWVYLAYTVDPNQDGVDTETDTFCRLTRYRADAANPNVADLSTRQVLIGATWSSGIPSLDYSHSAGSIRFGADKTLLMSAGDGAHFDNVDAGGRDPDGFGPGKLDPSEDIGAFRSLSLNSMAGKVLRVDKETGNGLASNPYWDGNPTSDRSRVWAYGFRNPYRFCVRPGTGSTNPGAGQPGVIYLGEVGWSTFEELNIVILAGRSLGWPCIEGPSPQSGYQGVTQTATPNPNVICSAGPNPENPAAPSAPQLWWHHNQGSLSNPPGWTGDTAIGGVFYTGASYPAAYQGRYFIADFEGHWIRVVTVDANNNVTGTANFASGADAPVDIEADPVSGDLFYVSWTTNEVRRIRYAPSNQPPVANPGGPYAGIVGEAIAFDGTGSSDPEGQPLTYAWDFGDGSTVTGATPTHAYAAVGDYNVTLVVSDGSLNSPPAQTTASITQGGGGGTLVLRQGADGYAGCTDTYLIGTAGYQNLNAGGRGELRIGRRSGEPLQPGLLRFDLSGIPAGSAIASAKLRLYNFSSGTSSPVSFGAYRLVKSWGEGTQVSPRAETGAACWNYARYATAPWSIPGAKAASDDAVNNDPNFDCTATPEAVTAVGGSGAWYEWEVTNAVERWLAGTWDNDGLLLRPLEDVVSDRRFHSSEATSASLRPCLVITFAGGPTNLPPVANPGGPYEAEVGQSIAFDGRASSDPEGQPLTYRWDFGDGSTGGGPAPTHTYLPVPRLYIVTLVVNDGVQDSPPAQTTAEMTNVNQPPVADAGGPYAGAVGQAIAFDGRGSVDPDGQPLTYSWTFGDGAAGAGPTPSHTYAAAGDYTATLVVNDGAASSLPDTTSASVTGGGGGTEIVLQQGLGGYAGCEDAYLIGAGSNLNSNTGGRYEMRIGKRVATEPAQPGVVRFDLSSLPAGSVVTGATLKLHCFGAASGTPAQLGAYRLVRSWGEGTEASPRPQAGSVCWNYTRYATAPWKTPGAGAASDAAVNNDPSYDRAATPVGVVTVGGAGAWYEWNVTAAVQHWRDGSWDNDGLFIGAVDAAAITERRFYASEHTTAALRPILVVTVAGPVAPPGELAKLSAAPPPATRLLGAVPNPFAGSTAIRYELGAPGTVRLRIYDVEGRLVRELVDRSEPPGAHEAVWDGLTGSGARAPSGIYLYRLEAPGLVATRRAVMVR